MLLVDGCVIVLDTARDIVAAQQPLEGARSGIEPQVGIAAQQCVGKSHMVGVVVGKEDAADMGDVDAVAQQFGRNVIVVDSGVDKYPLGLRAHIRAVAAGAAAERNEAQAPRRHGVAFVQEHVVAITCVGVGLRMRPRVADAESGCLLVIEQTGQVLERAGGTAVISAAAHRSRVLIRKIEGIFE